MSHRALGPQFYGQSKLPGMEHIAQHHVGMPGRTQYLRFGDWRSDETSENSVTGFREFGVSVYDLHPHTNEPMDPDPHWQSEGAEWALDGMQNRVRKWRKGYHPAHIVQGSMVGVGHDGEPLLQKLKRVGAWDGPAEERGRHE